VLHLLLGLMFLGFFVIGETLTLIIVGQLGLGFLTFFVKGMHVLTNLLTYGLLIENNVIGILGFHIVFSLELFINRYILPRYHFS